MILDSCTTFNKNFEPLTQKLFIFGIVLTLFEGTAYGASDYHTLDLSKYATQTVEWKYKKITPANYIENKENIPFHLSKLVKFGYDTEIQKFPINATVSQVYIFLNTEDARKYSYDQTLGWITLEFEGNDKIIEEIKIGKNIRNYFTTPFDDDYELEYRSIESIEDSNVRPVFSEVSKFYCREIYGEYEVCVDPEPEFERIDMLTITVPFTHVNKKLQYVSLEGNPNSTENAFVSAISIKSNQGTINAENLFVSNNDNLWVFILGSIFILVIVLVTIIMLRRRTQRSADIPRGAFSKRDGRFNPP